MGSMDVGIGRFGLWIVPHVGEYEKFRASLEKDKSLEDARRNAGRLMMRWLVMKPREAVANALAAFAEGRLTLSDLWDAGEGNRPIAVPLKKPLDGMEPLWRRAERLLDTAGDAPVQSHAGVTVR